MGSSIKLLILLLLANSSFGQQEQSSALESLLAAAQQEQAGNNYAAAAANYKKAVSLRPDVPELSANLGLMQHEAGDYPAAIDSFQRALHLNASLYVPNLFLGMDLVRTGDPKRAIPLLLKAEKLNAGDPLPSITLGRAYSSLGDEEAATRAFRRVVHLDPKYSSAWFDLGITQLRRVEEDARAETEAGANSSYAKALYAQALVEQLRYKEATSVYKDLIAAKDGPPCMRSELGFVLLRQNDGAAAKQVFQEERTEHSECSLSMLGMATLDIERGATQEAAQMLEQLWTRDQGFLVVSAPLLAEVVSPENLQSFKRDLAGKLASGVLEDKLYAVLTGPPQAATFPMKDAETKPPTVAHTPATKTALRSQGREAYMEGHYSLCTVLLKNSLDSRNPATLQILAACSFFIGQYALTADAAHMLRLLAPDSQPAALYWSIRANELLAQDSLMHFEQLEPDSARSHILLGDISRQRRRFEDAEKEYAKALVVAPNNIAALAGLGYAYFGDANFEKTREFATQGLLQSPEDPELNLLMGEALSGEHKFTDAEPFLLKSLSAKPQVLPHVHALLGQAFAEDGKTQEAIHELQLGAVSDQDGSLHYRLAHLYRLTGNTAAAALAVQQMKALQERRREGAVIALQDSHPLSVDDAQ